MRVLPLLLVLLGSCSLERKAAQLTVRLLQRGNVALESDDDIAFARVAAPGQIKAAEGLLETLPDDRDLLAVVAQGYGEYAFAFLEDELESVPSGPEHAAERLALLGRATALYDRSLGFSLRALATFDSHFPDAFRAGGPALGSTIASLPAESGPALALAGLAVASAINLNRADPSRLVDLPKAIAVLERARTLDRRFLAGASPMVLGIIYGQKPALGGQPARAKRYFEEAIDVTGGQYLMVKVMYARSYAVAVGDRALYVATLQGVMAAEPARLPREFRLANVLARRRAARSLAAVDQTFGAP